MVDECFVACQFTEKEGFTSGIEGPACDQYGNLYAVNFARQHTIGKVTPDGKTSVFIELPNGSIETGYDLTVKAICSLLITQIIMFSKLIWTLWGSPSTAMTPE